MSAEHFLAAAQQLDPRQVGAVLGAGVIAISSVRSAFVFVRAGRVFWGSCNFVAGVTSMVFWRQLFGG
jgi:hypothetical protein